MRRTAFLSGLVAVALVGCAGSTTGTNNTNSNINRNVCEATNASGIYLKSLGPMLYEVDTGATVALRTMVIRRDEDGSGGTGGVVAGAEVSYTIISVTGEATLSAPTALTNENGIAEVSIIVTESGTYQVAASSTGTCTVNFSVKAEDPRRSLETVTPNPLTTFTNRRVALTVHAFVAIAGQGEAGLADETITFTLGSGGSGVSLQDMDGAQQGDAVDVVTTMNGMATVMLNTGTAEVLSLPVTATLAGTAPVTISVKVQESGTGPCEVNADCPAGFVCEVATGSCVENPAVEGPCDGNEDCQAPYICHNGECVPPATSGQGCSPLVLNPCPSPQVCIAGLCQVPPGPCTNNDDCPTGYLCENGTCTPDIPPTETGCLLNTDCDGGFVCVGNICVPESDCTDPQPPDRLQGTWQFDQTLHLREALGGFLDGFLQAFELLRDVIQGNLSIDGVPGFVEDFIQDIIQGLMDAYVPPWAQEMIVVLGDISDIIDDMRVLSTVNLTAQGGYEYVGETTWDLVEFEYRGQTISDSPDNIDYISGVDIEPFTSRESCGMFFIDRHHVNNVVGGLIRWAIEVALTAVTCSMDNGPCYYSLDEALQDIIDCDAIAYAVDDLVYNAFDLSVYDIVYGACEGVKQPAIDYVIEELNNIEVSLSVMSLRGQANIATSDHLANGRWYGTLAFGDYDGEFDAVK